MKRLNARVCVHHIIWAHTLTQSLHVFVCPVKNSMPGRLWEIKWGEKGKQFMREKVWWKNKKQNIKAEEHQDRCTHWETVVRETRCACKEEKKQTITKKNKKHENSDSLLQLYQKGSQLSFTLLLTLIIPVCLSLPVKFSFWGLTQRFSSTIFFTCREHYRWKSL